MQTEKVDLVYTQALQAIVTNWRNNNRWADGISFENFPAVYKESFEAQARVKVLPKTPVSLLGQTIKESRRKHNAVWFNVWAQGVTAQGKKSAKVLLGKFRAHNDGALWAESVKKHNPTWTVEVKEGR